MIPEEDNPMHLIKKTLKPKQADLIYICTSFVIGFYSEQASKKFVHLY